MGNSEFSVALRNYAGVPVVELVGEINKRTVATLNDILGKLVQAGHYNVMLNLKRADWDGNGALDALKRAAKLLQTHYGNMDIIVEREQLERLAAVPQSFFRICTSEVQALGRIKKLPAQSLGVLKPTNARIASGR
jgi:hypothetical protein